MNHTREKPIIIRKTSAAVSVVVTVMVILPVIDNFSFKIRGRYSQPGSYFVSVLLKSVNGNGVALGGGDLIFHCLDIWEGELFNGKDAIQWNSK